MRLIADFLNQVQCRVLRRQLQRRAAIGENQGLQPWGSPFSFRHAEQPKVRQAKFSEGFGRYSNLATSAVDDDQRRRRGVSFDHFLVTAKNDLPNGCIVVPRLNVADVEAAVFRLAHFTPLIHDTCGNR